MTAQDCYRLIGVINAWIEDMEPHVEEGVDDDEMLAIKESLVRLKEHAKIMRMIEEGATFREVLMAQR